MYRIRDKYMFRGYPHREMWIFGDDNGKMYYSTDGYHSRVAFIKYKPPKSYRSDRFGQYFVAIFPDGGRKHIYIKDLVEYR